MTNNNKASRLLYLKFPHCGLGNKILMYYNMRMLFLENQDHYDGWFCEQDSKIFQYFESDYTGTVRPEKPYSIHQCPKMLGEKIFQWKDPKHISEFLTPIIPNLGERNTTQIAVHIRGGDFKVWQNGRAILPFEYYKSALDYIGVTFDPYIKTVYVATDDTSLEVYQRVVDYIVNHPNLVRMFSTGNEQEDFERIASAQHVVSSPSTFAITASMFHSGTYHKRIYHSREWVEEQANRNDQFWVDILNGGNKYYRAGCLGDYENESSDSKNLLLF